MKIQGKSLKINQQKILKQLKTAGILITTHWNVPQSIGKHILI